MARLGPGRRRVAADLVGDSIAVASGVRVLDSFREVASRDGRSLRRPYHGLTCRTESGVTDESARQRDERLGLLVVEPESQESAKRGNGAIQGVELAQVPERTLAGRCARLPKDVVLEHRAFEGL